MVLAVRLVKSREWLVISSVFSTVVMSLELAVVKLSCAYSTRLVLSSSVVQVTVAVEVPAVAVISLITGAVVSVSPSGCNLQSRAGVAGIAGVAGVP